MTVLSGVIVVSKILIQKADEVIDHSGVARVTVDKDLAEMTNVKPGKKIQKAVCQGKYGLFLAIWAEDQPKNNSYDDVKLNNNAKR